MKLVSNFFLDFGKDDEFYFKLLLEEDFDFKGKSISVVVTNDDGLVVRLECDSVLDLKIATNAVIKSLETIDKSLRV